MGMHLTEVTIRVPYIQDMLDETGFIHPACHFLVDYFREERLRELNSKYAARGFPVKLRLPLLWDNFDRCSQQVLFHGELVAAEGGA